MYILYEKTIHDIVLFVITKTNACTKYTNIMIRIGLFSYLIVILF